MILARDILAAITLLWLSSSAWDEQTTDSSIAASVRLAFYLPRDDYTGSTSSLLPAVLDVDGDGAPEALAMWKSTSEVDSTDGDVRNRTGWKVEILDLRPSLRPSPGGASTPFQPKVLLDSKLVEGATLTVSEYEAVPFHPLKMITGQVLTSNVRPTVEKKTISAVTNKTLQYFCGKDWHDAAHKCLTHCPSGHSSECEEGETCYADTPCSAVASLVDHSVFSTIDSLHKTPAGGWPSMFTAWSQGRVTMHSLTAEATNETATGGKANKKKTQQSPLQVILLWDSSPFFSIENDDNTTTPKAIVEWEDVDLTFVDALSAPEDQGSNAGMLLVTGTAMVYRPDKGEEHDESYLTSGSFVVALDAFTGKTLWRSSSSAELERQLFHHDEPAVLLPVVPTRGSTSVARRRSLIPGLDKSQGHHSGYMGHGTGTSTVNCMKEYRRSLLTSGALPYQYWGAEDDTSVVALHFDHQSGGSSHDHHSGHHNGKPVKASDKKGHAARKASSRHGEPSAQGKKKSRWLSTTFSRKKNQPRKSTLHLGRPNVVVTHNYEGIQVRALRNGRSLCHLSLEDHSLYADVNHDGTLDSLQVITSGRQTSMMFDRDDDSAVKERKWVEQLARRVTKMNDKSEEGEKEESLTEKLQQTPLCHILALSGLPSREELYSANLCAGRNFDQDGGARKDVNGATDAAGKQLEMQGAPLLLVESMGSSGVHGHDVIAAINTGTVSRFRGGSGRRVWQWDERRNRGDTFPTWDDAYSVMLARIDAENVILSARPIVLVGENSVALLAASSGHLLATSKFPQPSITRPRLVDLNGDGTTDLLVSTNDAVWGYHVVVRTGTSIPLRIIVGLLMMGLMLALVRNRFGPQPGKRSTDQ